VDITIARLLGGLHSDDMHSRPFQHPRISRHAIERYCERVAAVSAAVAADRLAEFAANSTRRPTPRRWTLAPPAPGVLFLYPHADPDICLVLKGDTIVTVFSRVVCLTWRTVQDSGPRRIANRQPYRRPSPGTWPLEAA
jgi:hypothetical protein